MVKVESMDNSEKKVIGGKVELTPLRNTLEATADYEVTSTTPGKAKAVKEILYREKKAGNSEWLKATVSSEFPAMAVEKGNAVEYELKKAFIEGDSANGKLESEIKVIKIIHKKKYTREDLKKLNFSFENGTLKATNYADIIKTGEVYEGTVKYKKDSDGEQNFVADGITGINTASTIKIYTSNENENTAITFTVKKLEAPVISQVDGKYQIKLNKVETNAKYQISNNNAVYKDVEVKEGGIIENIEHDGEEQKSYYVKAVAQNATPIAVNENAATVNVDSDASNKLDIAALPNLMNKKKLATITLQSDNAKNELTIGVPNDNLKDITDKVTYDYDGKKDVELDLTKKNDVKLSLKPGTFVLKVNKSEMLRKTINFVAPKVNAKYSKAEELIEALGGKAKAKAEYTIKAKGGAVADLDKMVDGEYTVEFKDATTVVNVAIGATQEYKLAAPVKVTIKKNTVSSPVIPSADNSAAPKKDEPKKDETKKDEVKKDEPKKDETKQAEDNKQSDSTSTTETKSEERVSAKNTKNNTVKVSEEKIAEALETGLKVMAKSGKVEFTAKAIEKMVGNSAEAVTVTLKTTATKSNAKEVTKNLKGSKLVSKKVFTLNIKAGNMAVKESQLSGTKINVTLKVNLKKAPMFVWVMDLSTGKKVKAAYKNGKLTFKTSNLGKFVIVNK